MSECSKATFNTTAARGNVKVNKRVEGKEGSNCLVRLKYVQAPGGMAGKEMTCQVPSGEWDNYETYLEGGSVKENCEGGLVEFLSSKGASTTSSSARCRLGQGFPCTSIEISGNEIRFTIQNNLGEEISNGTMILEMSQCPDFEETVKGPIPSGGEVGDFSVTCSDISSSFRADLIFRYYKSGVFIQNEVEGYIER